jgi:sulfate adenylyltransferase subunit 2
MEEYKLSHLKELEAESIHIIREVAAEFENPVMLYSIGKDSSVMVRLAEKAFYPGKVPFPLMHIDSKWKFKEMIQFRDEYAKKYGWNLIVESNMEAFHAGVGPFTHGSKVHTDLMKTQALLHALDKYKFDAAFGGARRDEEKSRAKERIFSFRDKFHQWDPKNQRPELWDIYPQTFSGGERLRLNLAHAMVKRPRLMLLDEPTASLDNKTKVLVKDILQQLKEEKTSMLGIFHDLEFMEGVCDKVFNMSEGSFA